MTQTGRHASGRGGALGDARSIVKETVAAYMRNDLLTKASAISYQALFALVPLALAGVALLGFLGLETYWRDDVAPTVEEQVSPEAFTVIGQTVEQVLSRQEFFWVTAGIALALWQVSGAVRAVSGALNEIHDAEEARGLVLRLIRSMAIALVISAALGGAVLALLLGPDLLGRVVGGAWRALLTPLVAYLAPGLLALVAMGVVVRFAPASPPPYRWIGVASVATVVAWIVATLGFRVYVTEIASYSSIFGGLASVIVLMTYLYLVANVFLGGMQIDAVIRRRLSAEAGD